MKLRHIIGLGLIVGLGMAFVSWIKSLELDKAGLEEFADSIEEEREAEKEKASCVEKRFTGRRYIKLPEKTYEEEV